MGMCLLFVIQWFIAKQNYNWITEGEVWINIKNWWRMGWRMRDAHPELGPEQKEI